MDMADVEIDNLKNWFEGALRGSSLELLLPDSKDVDLPKVLINRELTKDSTHEIPLRRTLFFDEQVDILVALKTSVPEEQLQQHLSNLELRLAAHATDAVPQGNNNAASASGKYDLVFTGFAADQNVTFHQADGFVYVVWTSTLHLVRPRVRLQRPAIYFTSTLTIRPNANTNRTRQNQYLQSFEPLSANVLHPLQSDPALTQSGIYLAESRVTKVAPRTSLNQDSVKPIRGSTKRAIPVVPAIFSRIRYSLMPDAVIASLHIETSTMTPGPVSIEDVSFGVTRSRVQGLNDLSWPSTVQAGDEVVLLYRITALDHNLVSSSSLKEDASTVSIAINTSMAHGQGPDIRIHVAWQTQTDRLLSHPRPMYRWSRPRSTTLSRPRLSVSAYSRPTSYDSHIQKGGEQPAASFTFTVLQSNSPKQDFRLVVQCNNHCHRARRFALVMLPYRRPQSKQLQAGSPQADLAAKVFQRHLPGELHPPTILDLNADIRIGPFPPAACYQTTMKFHAVGTGLLSLGTLRIVDLESKQTVDVRELPDVIMTDGTTLA